MVIILANGKRLELRRGVTGLPYGWLGDDDATDLLDVLAALAALARVTRA
jgi:hypothetical protein